MNRPPHFLCITCFFKGIEFIKACKAAGNKVFLVTSDALKDKPWPRESLDDIFFLAEDDEGQWKMEDLIGGLAAFMQNTPVDRIVALDDFDVERVAEMREHFRFPGMGQSTARFFRDKLAMRIQAKKGDIAVPPFSPLFHNPDINDFTARVDPPWIIKPRSQASAIGIEKVSDFNALWNVLDQLGNQRHNYLLEAFLEGDVYHVDSLSYQGKNIFSRSSQYLNTPFEVAHFGGIFRTQTLPMDSKDHLDLMALNQDLMDVFGMDHSASHSEFIKSESDGKFYFLETSSRVGGAHIAEMVEAASNINLWQEWAKIETAVLRDEPYQLPNQISTNAGSVMSLSRFEHPDDSSFQDPEIWWRLKKDHHIGFILRAEDPARIRHLLDNYAYRIQQEFHAKMAPLDRPAH
jgi:biotin carboxylase